MVPRLKSLKSFIKCTQPINTTAKAAVRMELWRERFEPLDASVHLNINADEHLSAGAKNPWTTWKTLNRLRTQVGRSRRRWRSNEADTCDCGIRQTDYMQHLLVCPMMNTACSTQDLTTVNDIAIGCARHWEGRFDGRASAGGRTRMMMKHIYVIVELRARDRKRVSSLARIVHKRLYHQATQFSHCGFKRSSK